MYIQLKVVDDEPERTYCAQETAVREWLKRRGIIMPKPVRRRAASSERLGNGER
jgi:hypothetical protein